MENGFTDDEVEVALTLVAKVRGEAVNVLEHKFSLVDIDVWLETVRGVSNAIRRSLRFGRWPVLVLPYVGMKSP